mmetsp:Transcript_48818/g.140358  ORF Transcript_48818/g.140358 Transcript_48818/m.140358 type:complete len:392 (-) Transcript_48818:170-1345(-)
MAARAMARAVAMALSSLVVLVSSASDARCSAGDACNKRGMVGDNLLLQVAKVKRSVRVEASQDWWYDQPPQEDYHGVQRRRRNADMGSCRRRHSTPSSNPPQEAFEEWQCRGDRMVKVGPPATALPPAPAQTAPPTSAPLPAPTETAPTTDAPTLAPTTPPTDETTAAPTQTAPPQPCESAIRGSRNSSCLCMFDVDRTLTGRQGDTRHCRQNRVLDLYDEAYGGGRATLSALTNAGIATTFCNECHLGITSAGYGSGPDSPWNNYILDHIMRGEVHDAFMQSVPQGRRWSYGTDVHSPFVLKQGNTIKQESVELVRQWYGRHGACIEPSEVYFFEDRTENVKPFAEKGLNSREISCGSRDRFLYGGTGMVGYCGARPEEVQRIKGNILCN